MGSVQNKNGGERKCVIAREVARGKDMADFTERAGRVVIKGMSNIIAPVGVDADADGAVVMNSEECTSH